MDTNYEILPDASVRLVQRIKSGDMTAFSVLYNRYWDPLYRLAYRMLKEHHLADDAIHDVFADLWERRKKLHIQHTLEGYLITCVKNRCLKVLHKIKRSEEISSETFNDTASHQDALHCKELQQQLQVLLDKFPMKSREIFTLSREEELSYKEIAHRTNLSIKSVEYHISKVLVKLKSALLFGILILIGG